MNKIQEVKKFGKKAQGQKEYIKFLKGEKITRKEAMLANCYECTCWYADGVNSCQMKNCPLYPYHPYRK
ncbi:hypothetical protein JCM12298_30470 [Desulfothermus naphthae]